MSDPILAAVMTAPRAPIELREFPRPDLPAGAVLLRTLRSEVCGTDVHLWHGRLAGVPYPIIPGHVSAGVIDAVRGPVTGTGRIADPRRRSRRVLRRASHVRPLPRLHRAPHADALRGAPRLRHHRLGGRGAVRRMGPGDLPRARRRHRAAARRDRRSTTTSAAAADCSPRCTSSSAPRSGWATRSSCRARAPSA